MPIQGSQTEFSIQTRELSIKQSDVIALFLANGGITISDPNQVFTVIVRNIASNGDIRDQVLGDLGPNQYVVLQTKQVTAPASF